MLRCMLRVHPSISENEDTWMLQRLGAKPAFLRLQQVRAGSTCIPIHHGVKGGDSDGRVLERAQAKQCAIFLQKTEPGFSGFAVAVAHLSQ